MSFYRDGELCFTSAEVEARERAAELRGFGEAIEWLSHRGGLNLATYLGWMRAELARRRSAPPKRGGEARMTSDPAISEVRSIGMPLPLPPDESADQRKMRIAEL